MNILFRVDSGFHIGLGHLRRCLTLAKSLVARGCEVSFAGRNHEHQAQSLIEKESIQFYTLGPGLDSSMQPELDLQSDNPYASWLGVNIEEDIRDTKRVLSEIGQVDCLVVDHYALDASWERAFSSTVRVVVLDDLANRKHCGDILIDANLHNQDEELYKNLIPQSMKTYIGLDYILLRHVFQEARCQSRSADRPARGFISFGGADVQQDSLKTLRALLQLEIPLEVDMIALKTWPHYETLVQEAQAHDWLRVHDQVEDPLEMMCQSSFAIGAAGMTMWERCCIGLPSLVMINAHNQDAITRRVAETGAIHLLGPSEKCNEQTIRTGVNWLLNHPKAYASMREKSLSLVDGKGAERISDAILGKLS